MINIAIIGAGIGREHLAALRELSSEFRVVAVVDQNLKRIEKNSVWRHLRGSD